MDKKIFTILVATMFISMLGFGIVVPLLPIYANQLGATPLEIGLINGAFSLAILVFLPIIGIFSDRFGRKVFLCSGLAILIIASWLYLGPKPFTANSGAFLSGPRGIDAFAYCPGLPR